MNEDFHALVRDIRACKICVEAPLKAPLPHAPNPVFQPSNTARIAICGQAPGNLADQTDLPFNDPSGDRLRAWLGVSREQFYNVDNFAMIPMGFCFPGYDAKGSDLPPRVECRTHWHQRLLAAMPQVDMFLLIGQYAQAYHLGQGKHKTLTETVQHWRDFAMVNHGAIKLPMPHPSWRNNAWIKRHPWFEAELIPYLRREVSLRIS